MIDAEVLREVRTVLEKARAKIALGQLAAADRKISRAEEMLMAPPAAPDAPGGFVFSMPFSWEAAKGPMPAIVESMLGDGVPQPDWVGRVSISLPLDGFSIVSLTDRSGNPIGPLTPEFTGQWPFFVVIATPEGKTHDFYLRAMDPVSGIAGGSHSCTWITT